MITELSQHHFLTPLAECEGHQDSAIAAMESTPPANSWVNQPLLLDEINDSMSEADADTLLNYDFLPNQPQQTIRYKQPVSWGK